MQSIIKFIFSAVLLCIGFGVVYAQTSNTIIPPAYTTFFDQNGHPLSGGSVYFYVPLTTTPKGTYQDAAGTLPNTQPVVLDAAGKALILGFGSYRQIVFDKNNNQIWDQTVQSVGGNSNGGVVAGDGLSVGTILPWTGFVAPTNYAFAYGQTLSRTTNAALMSAITQSESMTCQGGNATLSTISDTSQVPIGAVVEIPCMAAGSTVVSKTTTSLTLTNMASVNLTTTGVIFPYGDGDQSTTFTLPDYRGKYLPGRCNMGGAACTNLTTAFGVNTASALGANGGLQSATLATANLPAYTPSGAIANGAITSTAAGQNAIVGSGGTQLQEGSGAAFNQNAISIVSSQASSTFTGVAQGGVATPLSIIPPSETINYIIKITPDIFTSGYSQILGASPINVVTLGTVATVSLNAAAVTGLPNTALTNDSVTINGTPCVLGAACSVAGSAITILPPVRLATTISLAVNTYNNGASGVGATITENAHGALTIDGVAANTNDVVLIKNEGTQANNGIYTVTNAGSGGASFVLTRISYFNQASNMLAGSYVLVTAGATNINNSYVLQATTTTVGTTAVVFNLFSGSGTVVNSIGAKTGAITLSGATMISQTLSVYGNGGIFDTVVQYGADNTGTNETATAINTAIAAACPVSGQKGRVYLPAGKYKVDGGINLTGLTQGCVIYGDGPLATELFTTTSTNALLDLTGSGDVSVRDLQVNIGAGTNYGVLLAATVAQGCNIIDFDHVSITGNPGQAGVYIYGCSDSKFNVSQVSNFNKTAVYVVFIGTTNILGATSNFTTIITGTVPSGDWNFVSFEIHDLSTFSPAATSTVQPLSINGFSSPIKFIGGVVAGSPTGNAGYVDLENVSNVSFIGSQLYADNGISAPYAFYNSGNTVTGLLVKNTNAITTAGTFDVANSTTWAHLDVTGNASFGAVPLFKPLTSNNGTLISSIVDAQGQAINMGASGSVTHTVMLQPGAITAGTQANNGSF